jgi:HSP20 family protein
MTTALQNKIRETFPTNRFPSLFRSSLFDDIFSGMENIESAFFQKGGTPCDIVEIKDNNGNVIANEFSYALAGYEKDNVNIEIDDNRLTITVYKSEETKDEDTSRTYLHKGLTRKMQQWSYVLNSQVDSEKVSADMKDGILKVTIPLLTKKEIKKIEVK